MGLGAPRWRSFSCPRRPCGCSSSDHFLSEVCDEEYNSSQDDLASVPGDEAELPLCANDCVYRRYHLFRFLQISRALVLTELDCEDNVIFLFGQLIIVDEVEHSRLLFCMSDVWREDHAIVRL